MAEEAKAGRLLVANGEDEAGNGLTDHHLRVEGGVALGNVQVQRLLPQCLDDRPEHLGRGDIDDEQPRDAADETRKQRQERC